MNEAEAIENLRQCERWVAMAYGDGVQDKPFVNYEGSVIGCAVLRSSYELGRAAAELLTSAKKGD